MRLYVLMQRAYFQSISGFPVVGRYTCGAVIPTSGISNAATQRQTEALSIVTCALKKA